MKTDVVESFLRSWNEFPQKYLLLINIVEKSIISVKDCPYNTKINFVLTIRFFVVAFNKINF